MKRREILKYIGVSPLGLSYFYRSNYFSSSLSLAGEHVVVIGGGMAGTTAAKYLRLWGEDRLKVTLIEPNETYFSNIFSNKVITNDLTLDNLAYNYDYLTCQYGVNFLNDRVMEIDPVNQAITLESQKKVLYDKLIVAPGVDFDPLPISGSASNIEKIVHAWQAGPQTTVLKDQVAAMSASDTFILTIPPKPFRCPPGPYERACVIADYLKRKNGSANVIILDANDGIQAGVDNFSYAFSNTHADAITYVPNAVLQSIDADLGRVNTSQGSFTGQVINAIPPHRAAKLITESGIGLANSNDGKWAEVDVLNYESTSLSNIHVIGDSSSTTQPKAGHVANAEAKICADAIIRMLKGESINAAPMTNSACFTPITHNTASWLTVVYRYDPVTKTMKPTGNGVTESDSANQENYDQMNKWFHNLMSDTFGYPVLDD